MWRYAADLRGCIKCKEVWGRWYAADLRVCKGCKGCKGCKRVRGRRYAADVGRVSRGVRKRKGMVISIRSGPKGV